ncbi:MAG: hypothetical protein Kow0090_04180 [Myxococcota bacterium]
MEIMIAVSILGFIVTIIWASFGRTLSSREYVISIQERYQEIRTAMDRIARELSVAYISTHLDNVEKRTKTLFKAKRSGNYYEVLFTALAGLKLYENQNASDQCVLKYFVEIDTATGKSNLIRRSKDIVGENPEEEKDYVDFVMLEDVVAMEFKFYDEQQDQWVDEWDTEGVERGFRLPPTVRFSITVLDEFGKEQKFTTQTRIWMTKPFNFNWGL